MSVTARTHVSSGVSQRNTALSAFHAPPPVHQLRLENVCCAIHGRQLLNKISLSFDSGEFLAVLGPNGAGKTTLLRLLALALKPTGGRLEVFGHDVAQLGWRAKIALKRRISYVAQRSLYNPMIPLTTYDVLATGLLGGATVWGRLSCAQRNHLEEIAEQFGIAHLLHRPYRVLSGGEQQKVQIARAWAQQPELLLLDEPTSGLDLTWQRRLVELLESLQASTKLSIIMTTHHPHHLPPSCRRVALLSEGHLVYDGQREQSEFVDWCVRLFGEDSPNSFDATEIRWGAACF